MGTSRVDSVALRRRTGWRQDLETAGPSRAFCTGVRTPCGRGRRIVYRRLLMPDGIEIRRARAADREVVLGLWLALIEYHRQLACSAIPALPDSGLRREIERGLVQPGCAVWIAEHEGRSVGFAFAEAAGSGQGGPDGGARGWIHELWVEPAWRRRGVASALVAHARSFLTPGSARISVRVEAGNAGALEFWQHLGFLTRAHLLENCDRTGPDAGAARR